MSDISLDTSFFGTVLLFLLFAWPGFIAGAGIGALIGTLVPTTYAGHRFWEETDDAARAQQRIHFLKNLGLLGGLILCLVDTEGKPSLGWKARRSAKRAGLAISSGKGRAGRLASSSAHEAAVNIEELLAVAAATGGRAGRKARKAAEAPAAAARTEPAARPAP